jgi:hypothetical protein
MVACEPVPHSPRRPLVTGVPVVPCPELASHEHGNPAQTLDAQTHFHWQADFSMSRVPLVAAAHEPITSDCLRFTNRAGPVPADVIFPFPKRETSAWDGSGNRMRIYTRGTHACSLPCCINFNISHCISKCLQDGRGTPEARPPVAGRFFGWFIGCHY